MKHSSLSKVQLEPQPLSSSVYFVGGAGKIKIGYAANITSRFRQLRSSSPVELTFLGYCAGDRRLEAELHGEFRDIRSHFEWFNEAPDLTDRIEQLVNPLWRRREPTVKAEPLTEEEWHLHEMQTFATVLRTRCFPDRMEGWKPSRTARGVQSQIETMVMAVVERMEALAGAINWIEPPFVDADTPEHELRNRVRFAVKDAANAKL